MTLVKEVKIALSKEEQELVENFLDLVENIMCEGDIECDGEDILNYFYKCDFTKPIDCLLIQKLFNLRVKKG